MIQNINIFGGTQFFDELSIANVVSWLTSFTPNVFGGELVDRYGAKWYLRNCHEKVSDWLYYHKDVTINRIGGVTIYYDKQKPYGLIEYNDRLWNFHIANNGTNKLKK